MTEFKVGDRVRRISNQGSMEALPIGSEWTVQAASPGGDIYLKDDPLGGGRLPTLFELVNPPITSAKDIEELYA